LRADKGEGGVRPSPRICPICLVEGSDPVPVRWDRV
jgi:hypothetical protein